MTVHYTVEVPDRAQWRSTTGTVPGWEAVYWRNPTPATRAWHDLTAQIRMARDDHGRLVWTWSVCASVMTEEGHPVPAYRYWQSGPAANPTAGKQRATRAARRVAARLNRERSHG
jgi:hypothetical protein